MKTRLLTILISSLCLFALSLFSSLAVHSEVTAEPTDYMICYLNTNRYVLQPVETLPIVTPTRIVIPTAIPSATPNPCIATAKVAVGTLNIRQANNTTSSIVGTLKLNDVVEIMQIADGWLRLCDGRGWIASKDSRGNTLAIVTIK